MLILFLFYCSCCFDTRVALPSLEYRLWIWLLGVSRSSTHTLVSIFVQGIVLG